MKLTFVVIPATGAPFELTEANVKWLVGILPTTGVNQVTSCKATEHEILVRSSIEGGDIVKAFTLEFDNYNPIALNQNSVYLLIELNNKRWMDPEITRPDKVGSDARFEEFTRMHGSLLKAIIGAIEKSFSCSIVDEDPFISLISGDMIIELGSINNT